MEFEGVKSPDFISNLLNSEVTVTIWTFDLCRKIVSCGMVELMEVVPCNDCESNYILRYRVPKLVTRNVGKYKLLVEIKNLETNFVSKYPLQEYVIINVI